MEFTMLSSVISYNKYVEDLSNEFIELEIKRRALSVFDDDTLSDVKFAYFDGVKEQNYIGNNRALYVLANATKVSGDITESEKYGKILASDPDSIELIIGDEVVANYYFKNNDHHFVNILVDVIRIQDDFMTLSEILFQIKDIIESKDSWGKGDNEALLANLDRMLNRERENRISNLNSEVRSLERDIDSYRERLITLSRRHVSKVSELKVVEKTENNISDKLAKDFDLIVKLDKVTRLKITDIELEFKTTPLNFFDQHGTEYKGGEYTVKVDFSNGRMEIDSSYTVSGGWSDRDPHPHVSGSSKRPCLGSVTSTIADLVSQNEYYAMVIMIINYLEAVDTTDSVGEYAHHWGRYKDGELVYEDNRERDIEITCEHCGDAVYEGQDWWTAYTAYSFDDNGEVDDVERDSEVLICESCVNNAFHYDNNVDEYMVD